MEKIEINHFKAFGSRLALTPSVSRKNLLICGENGSGKTSIFEAIKVTFYHNQMLKKATSKGASQEVKQAEAASFYRQYNHKQPVGSPTTQFSISINGADFKAFDSSNYLCFMLSNSDLRYEQFVIQGTTTKEVDKINLEWLFSKLYFPNFEPSSFLASHATTLINNVNNTLKTDFVEDCRVYQENQKYDIGIEQGSLRESDGLRKLFNEARINLIIILLYLESVKIIQAGNNTGKHAILVMDDLVTSLDASNRLFFTNYLLTKFNSLQKIIFTHNVGFNNLIVERTKEFKESDNWVLLNLYLTENGPQLYSYADLMSAVAIREEFSKGLLSPVDVGVEIRKRFEADINEIAKLFRIDATATAMDIVSDILQKNDRFYFRKYNKKLLDANNLVTIIIEILNGTETDAVKVSAISTEINKYHSDADVVKLFGFIKEFHYFEKIFIHSMSHGSAPMPTFVQKEVQAATHLLEQIEKQLSLIKNNILTP